MFTTQDKSLHRGSHLTTSTGLDAQREYLKWPCHKYGSISQRLQRWLSTHHIHVDLHSQEMICLHGAIFNGSPWATRWHFHFDVELLGDALNECFAFKIGLVIIQHLLICQQIPAKDQRLGCDDVRCLTHVLLSATELQTLHSETFVSLSKYHTRAPSVYHSAAENSSHQIHHVSSVWVMFAKTFFFFLNALELAMGLVDKKET